MNQLIIIVDPFQHHVPKHLCHHFVDKSYVAYHPGHLPWDLESLHCKFGLIHTGRMMWWAFKHRHVYQYQYECSDGEAPWGIERCTKSMRDKCIMDRILSNQVYVVTHLSYMLTKEQNLWWNFLSKVTIKIACTAQLITSFIPCA